MISPAFPTWTSPCGRATIHHGDCLDVMRSMPDGSVDAVVTDPPYGVNYAEWDGNVPPQDVLTECLRVSRGPVVWFGAAKTDVMLACLAYEPMPDRCLVWAPSFSLSQTGSDGALWRWHPIWCWRPDGQTKIGSDVLRAPCEGRHWWDHPATKPVSLLRTLATWAVIPGGTVLDPFLGSGTTLVAALQEGCKAIGIEREAPYVEIAKARAAHESKQGSLFA